MAQCWQTMRAMAKPVPRLTPDEIQRVIATAWDDRPPFNSVLMNHGLTQGQLVQLLRRELTASAFKMWTTRTRGGSAPTTVRARRR